MNILTAKTRLYKLVIFLIFSTFLYSNINYELTWASSGRVHSEFKWYTIKTENFNVHYHEEIESIAIAGANIAEQVLPTLLEQIELDSISVIDIILTTEDEIMNGFAMFTNQTFIWVDQNDAAVWLEDQKWLEQVIAHELQHIVWFNKVKTWLPEPYSLGYGGTPGWFVEGIAEYYTEDWRPYRSEINHKYNILKNSTSSMDPHHDGFSKIKLLAQTYGDSTIIELLNHRTKYKLFKFDEAFKEATGISVSEFNDYWRRTVSTYYYGYRAQKEVYEDAGKVSKLPISKLGSLVSGFKFSSDSMHIAMIGKDKEVNNYLSLMIASIDTTSSNNKNNKKRKNKDLEGKEKDEEEKKKKKVKFNKKEIDFGRFHKAISWSNDNQYLAYSKYHYANNNSRVFDLCLYDMMSDDTKWITNNLRATYPVFTLDNKIIFVSHSNSTSNFYKVDVNDLNQIEQLTFFKGDTQLLTPSISKDGSKLIFGMSTQDGNLDIYLLDLETNDVSRKTFNEAVDYLPIFDDDENIIFTSHRSGTPNLFKLDKNNSIVQCTDLSDGIWGIQLDPKDNFIIANTLNDVDSTRIIKIDPNRVVNPIVPTFNEIFSSWKEHAPPQKIDFNEISRDKIDYKSSIVKYKPLKNIKHVWSNILPIPGIIGTTNWSDRIGRNIFILSTGTYNYTLENFKKDFPPTFFVFNYTNAYNGPLFGFNYFYNSNFFAKFYDKARLLEKKDGAHMWMSLPYNSGNNDYSNHLLKFELESSKRKSFIFYDSLLVENENLPGDSLYILDRYGLPTPAEGHDNALTISYRYLNKKPISTNWYLPSNGVGVETRIILGQKDWNSYYQKIAFDSYFNFKLKGLVVYSRLKIESIYGDVFPQDEVWFTQDNPIYVSGQRGGQIFGENLSPRGWRGDPLMGTQMLFSTIEVRQPIPISIPIEAFGTKLGKSSIALFQDYGIIDEQSVHTLGYEAKISILNSNSPIVFLSYGESQTIDRWIDKKRPFQYIQMSLINPF